SIVGRAWQRNAKTMDDVLEDGALVLAAMRATETYLSEFAPKHFPGLLDKEWFPKAEHENIEEQIRVLEAGLSKVFEDSNGKEEKWQAAVVAAGNSIELHDEAIGSASQLTGTMYIRLREALHLANRRHRLNFLLFLKRYIDNWIG